jgi:hypothetical protein
LCCTRQKAREAGERFTSRRRPRERGREWFTSLGEERKEGENGRERQREDLAISIIYIAQ